MSREPLRLRRSLTARSREDMRLSLDPVPEGTLKDIYTVTARVKNGEESGLQ